MFRNPKVRIRRMMNAAQDRRPDPEFCYLLRDNITQEPQHRKPDHPFFCIALDSCIIRYGPITHSGLAGGIRNHNYDDNYDRIADKSDGVVVAVIDTKQFSAAYPEGWSYLKTGMLVETEEMGLVHYPEPNEDVVFINRSGRPPSVDPL